MKGTIFTVRSNEDGASVEVKRGAVAVSSKEDGSRVTVRAGQEAGTSARGTLEVSGEGTLPVVVDHSGKPVAADDTVKVNANNGKSGEGNNGNGNGNSGKDTLVKPGKDKTDDSEDD